VIGRGIRRVGRPLLWAALVLFVVPSIDLVRRSAPIDYSAVWWRFVFARELADACLIPFLALMLAGLVASATEDRRMLGVVSVVSIIVAMIMMQALAALSPAGIKPGPSAGPFWAKVNLVDLRMDRIRLLAVGIGCSWMAVAGLRGIRWRAWRRPGRVIDPGEGVRHMTAFEITRRRRIRERTGS
jgi:hypothetical protein